MQKVVAWVQNVLVPLLGPAGLFVASFLDSSFLSLIEINDLLVVTGAAGRPGMAGLYVAMTTLGSVAGCLVLRELGRRGGEALLRRRLGSERVERTRGAFRRWDVLALAIPAVLPPPMPFKAFVLTAGVFGFPIRRFALTLLVARGLRYTFWAAMGILYGEQARGLLSAVDAWLGERLPALGAVIAASLLVAFAVYVLRRNRNAVSLL